MTAIDNPTRGAIAEDAAQRVRKLAGRNDVSEDVVPLLAILRDYLAHGSGVGEFEQALTNALFADVLGEVLDRLAEAEAELEELRGQH